MAPTTNLVETISVAQAGVLLGISRKTAYKLAKTGELPGVRKLGGRYKVVTHKLYEYLDGKQNLAFLQ
jgi:excisionase family DNA binding protein